MPRREGTVDSRVKISVSSLMRQLRVTQTSLNRFLWTTELSYGYILESAPGALSDRDKKAAEALGHITSGAWYRNNQGRIKLDETVGQFLDDVACNTIHVYRSVVVHFFSAFEAYLEDRVGELKQTRGGWGPYLRSLAVQELMSARYPVRVRTVLCADLSREVRNRMVHPPFEIPDSLAHPLTAIWRKRLTDVLIDAGWATESVERTVAEALAQVIGQVANHISTARKEGKTYPPEYFYMLFAFTNLDNLAFEIEEAMMPTGIQSDAWVWRKRDYVRRTDLLVD